jgi:hypothetical protein
MPTHQVINGEVVDTDTILTRPEYDRLKREREAVEDTAKAENDRQVAEYQERQFRQRQRDQAEREAADLERQAALEVWSQDHNRLQGELACAQTVLDQVDLAYDLRSVKAARKSIEARQHVREAERAVASVRRRLEENEAVRP